MSVIGTIAEAVGCRDGEPVIAAALRLREERDRFHAALVEIDTYLANDPDVWRLGSVAKAGDVLCDVLGAETIGRINASVGPLLCPACRRERDTA